MNKIEEFKKEVEKNIHNQSNDKEMLEASKKSVVDTTDLEKIVEDCLQSIENK